MNLFRMLRCSDEVDTLSYFLSLRLKYMYISHCQAYSLGRRRVKYSSIVQLSK